MGLSHRKNGETIPISTVMDILRDLSYYEVRYGRSIHWTAICLNIAHASTWSAPISGTTLHLPLSQ